VIISRVLLNAKYIFRKIKYESKAFLQSQEQSNNGRFSSQAVRGCLVTEDLLCPCPAQKIRSRCEVIVPHASGEST